MLTEREKAAYFIGAVSGIASCHLRNGAELVAVIERITEDEGCKEPVLAIEPEMTAWINTMRAKQMV